MIFNRHGRLTDLPSPSVMGILNVTPDSFFAGSRVASIDALLEKADLMIRQGADILDVGACSTRPGALPVPPEEEIARLAPALHALRSSFPDAIISVDTFYASVAERCVAEWNVDIINDVSGGRDPEMFPTIGRLDVPYVLTHTRGDSVSMMEKCLYGDVVADVISELAFKLDSLFRAGATDVIIDPGFGFAKDLDQNYRLMGRLEDFKKFSLPLMVGVSRKSMVTRLLDCSAEDALDGTIALDTVAMMKGADIVRVHDVLPAVRSAAVVRKILASTSPKEEIDYYYNLKDGLD